MQVVDNMLVVHNMDKGYSQLYDIKLADYSTSVLKKDRQYSVSTRLLKSHNGTNQDQLIYMSDLLLAEEKSTSPDETCYSKPV